MRKNCDNRLKNIKNDFWGIYDENKLYKANIVTSKIVGIYFIIGSLWVIFSDKILFSTINDANMLRHINVFKGWFYVFFTAIILYYSIRRNIKRNEYLVRKLVESYENLEVSNEELIAAEEELRGQYELLQSNKENMYKLAHYDSLTEMPNRTLFLNNLEEAIKNSILKQDIGALIFVDLDNFKNINDTLGHSIGDELLKAVSKTLSESIETYGTVYRSGGDEFSIIIPHAEELGKIEDLCGNIVSSFSKAYKIDNNQIYATSSFGVTIFPNDGKDINIIMKNADISMYKSKFEGKNRFTFFDEEIYHLMVRKAIIENQLRTAIEENELFVNYQPIVNPATGKIKGLEALIRWINNELGFVSPGEFISIAEEVGLIVPIGYWIFEKVAEQMSEWKQKGYDIEMASVNVSSIQIRQTNFVENLKDILKKTKCKGEWINIEITEGTLITMSEKNLRVFDEIREMGMTISLDDFGTGYSSLSYLKNIRFDILKIDKSLIDDIHNNDNSRDIVDGIIQLAHKINLEVNAEGVELKEQVNTLEAMNCDLIQGYYYSKPVREEDFEKLLSDNNGIII